MAGPAHAAPLPVEKIRFPYTTHDGRRSYALLLLPGWYGPKRHPVLPLVICAHGRNTTPEQTARRWVDLPTRGGFAVVLPAGMGRVLQLYSWGYPGQIADLARMPKLAEQAVPGFRYDAKHVYAVGASMGGQEVLLLLAKHPNLLAGVVAFDPAVNLANRYYEFPFIRFGKQDQRMARIEMGGTPRQVPEAYSARSPATFVRRIAESNVPLQLWWSIKDQVIVNQSLQAGRFYQELKLINPRAPVTPWVGTWKHAEEVSAFYQLPGALVRLGLLSPTWLVHDPYRFYRQPSDREVSRLVERAQIGRSAALARSQELVSGAWRTAALVLAGVTLVLLLSLAPRARRRGRRGEEPAGAGQAVTR